MWPDAYAGPEDRVYFHAWQAIGQTSQSPNAALLGTTLVFPVVHHRAMLGIWRDCDRDGYVGHAELGLQDYAAALADPAVCPVGSHQNDGTWVSEMIGIGMVDPCEHEPPEVRARECPTGNPTEPIVGAFAPHDRVLYSEETYVWGDVGAPGSVPRAECAVAPAPRGTTSGTGPLLRWADCQEGYRVELLLGLAGQPTPDVAFPVTLFGAPDGRPGLLQQGSGAPAFEAWDCSAERRAVPAPLGIDEVVLHDSTEGRLTGPMFPLVVTGYTFEDDDGDASTGGNMRIPLSADGEGNLLFVPTPAPRDVDPTGSWWDAAEATGDGVRGDCDPRTRSYAQARHPGHLVEDGDHLVPAARKDRASLTFTFYDGHRGFNRNVDPYTGENAPADGGLMLLRHGRGGDGPLWSALESTTQDPQVLQRGDVAAAPPSHFTYYARVGPDVVSKWSLKLPTASPGAYGSDNCGSTWSGQRHGWVCDPAAWWKDDAGHDVRPRYAQGEPIGRVPGDPYDLRDVDCYDGSLARGSGAYASPAFLSSEGPCRL